MRRRRRASFRGLHLSLVKVILAVEEETLLGREPVPYFLPAAGTKIEELTWCYDTVSHKADRPGHSPPKRYAPRTRNRCI